MNTITHTTVLTALLAMTCLSNAASAVPIIINSDNFYADPTVTVAVDGSSATIEEDPFISPVWLINDPFFGHQSVVIPGENTVLSFDYDFVEGVGNDDTFNAFILDSTTGAPVGPSFEFFVSGTSSGSHSFDLSSLADVGFDLGLQFELVSNEDPFSPPLDSTVIISNLRLETVTVNPVPEPSTVSLFLLSSLLFPFVKRRVSLNK